MSQPQGLKPAFLLVVGGTAEEVAEKVFQSEESVPQALKRGHILNGLAARVELVPFPTPPEPGFSATSEAVPFPKPICETYTVLV